MAAQSNESIQFLEYQKPALESGDYSITIEQKIQIKKNENESEQMFGPSTLNFSVCSERFSLDPAAVHAMFPPAGSLGKHTDVLPHITLKRSTFPWERSAYSGEDDEPWVALLLFDEEELNAKEVEQKTLTLKQLQSESSDVQKPKFPTVYNRHENAKSRSIKLETGQQLTDKVTVIDIKKSLLEQLIPSGAELKLLAHVRQRVNGNPNAPETELAVVMCNRLPKAGSGSTAHLVSVEGRYTDDKTFDYQNAEETGYIRLVTLKSWSFACPDKEGKTFEELVEALNTGTLCYPTPDSAGDASVEKYLTHGYIALPHYLRQGDTTYSWYHSPLTSQPVARQFNETGKLPEFGDALIRYHQDIGMFDVTYAAAFELGRALALEESVFAAALYQWKHAYNTTVCLELQQHTKTDTLRARSFQRSQDMEKDPLETTIIRWLEELASFKHIPFNYLVPDETMLPSESIRFFKVDEHWLESLFLGALSIGGPIRENSKSGKTARTVIEPFIQSCFREKSGFILRSALVSGYPDLLVDAFSAKIPGTAPLTQSQIKTKLNNVRMERLAPDVLFCLFEGEVNTAAVYLKPEGLHFGLDEEDASDGRSMKYEKNIEGKTVSLPDLKNKDKRILDIKGIADTIKSINSAQFGMCMLEGSNKGRFVIKE